MDSAVGGLPQTPGAVFVGVGELPSGRYPERNFMGDLVVAAHLALADAELTPRDVDTILLIPCLHSFVDQADLIFSRVVEELGLSKSVKSQFMVHSGGSTSDNAVRAAGSLLTAGEAETVLILQCERWGSAPVEEMIDTLSFNGIPLEWEIPCGQNFNAIGALITARYMYETGSTPEDMAGICVALRKWANLNPNAMYRDKAVTVEKILASKVVCEPLHAMECPMMADGAVGLVMTTPELAARRHQPSVRIVGTGGCVSHYSLGQETDLARLGWPKAAEMAYEASGWGPEDVQLAEVYDSYAAVMAIAFEGLGLCKPGEGARFIASGETSPGGSLPSNTNGGLLSAGHTGVGGGTALLAEGVRQLLGRAGPERQLPDVRRALIGGTGGSYMDAQVMMLERVDARGTGGVPPTRAAGAAKEGAK